MLSADGALVAGARVLDLYAGSGALAFEALSRGASAAVVVEHARDALAAIRDNARALGALPMVTVVTGRVERALERDLRDRGEFDVVFLDPPYADVREAAFAEVLAAAARRVAAGGALVLEHASADPAPEVPALRLDRSRRYGDTSIALYYRREGETK
jgi:16S rRNA (guanine966-N2)-methyltransferase